MQRKPSFETDRIISTKPINWLEKVRCPKGTVHVQRITKDDIAGGKSLLNNSLIYQDSSSGHAMELLKSIRGAHPMIHNGKLLPFKTRERENIPREKVTTRLCPIIGAKPFPRIRDHPTPTFIKTKRIPLENDSVS
ncbi:uncharacterized protein LOC131656745 [Vicia villosa]|uniref:uncharacterized protein LOC131656745 n=1 Tax=Vicia villosa TaxID=3911 RepID=UPI00273BAF55|nr:uncharacterized protein LOC131656745 [Vicia villosa]